MAIEQNRLIVRNHFALLRNLRNICESGVSTTHMKKVRLALAHDSWTGSKILPFRFLAAAKHAPVLEDEIDAAMIRAAGALPKLAGHTLLIVDVSGSMNSAMGGKSELTRLDAAAALTILAREQCERVTIVCTAGNDSTQRHATMLIPPRRGMALRDAVVGSRSEIGGGGIFLVQVMEWIKANVSEPADRVVVFTDEQDCDHTRRPDSAERIGKIANYLVNVGAYKNGIVYSPWVKVDGFSEHVLDFVAAHEATVLQ